MENQAIKQETEAQKEATTKIEVTEANSTISKEQFDSLVEENKKLVEASKKQQEQLKKLLEITKDAKIEEVQAQLEEQRPQIDSFELYKMEKQKERDKFLIDQMREETSIEAYLMGKKATDLTTEDRKLIQHHQEVTLLRQLDRILRSIDKDSNSVYKPLKEQLTTLRNDLSEFNYVKIFMDYMEHHKDHAEQVSNYVKPHEVPFNFKQKNFAYERQYNYMLKRIYK